MLVIADRAEHMLVVAVPIHILNHVSVLSEFHEGIHLARGTRSGLHSSNLRSRTQRETTALRTLVSHRHTVLSSLPEIRCPALRLLQHNP